MAGSLRAVANAPGTVPNQLRLPCARLPWLFKLLIGADRAAALGRGYMATSANVTQRLHALLGAVVVSGAWRDFLPSWLAAVFVLGEVERRVHKPQIEGAALTWCFWWQGALQLT